MPLEGRPANLQHVCEEAIMEIRAAHPDAALLLQTSGKLPASGTLDRLLQAISNLIINAIQHGSGTPITLTGKEQAEAVTLAGP